MSNKQINKQISQFMYVEGLIWVHETHYDSVYLLDWWKGAWKRDNCGFLWLHSVRIRFVFCPIHHTKFEGNCPKVLFGFVGGSISTSIVTFQSEVKWNNLSTPFTFSLFFFFYFYVIQGDIVYCLKNRWI